MLNATDECDLMLDASHVARDAAAGARSRRAILACGAFVHDLTRDQRRGLVSALALELSAAAAGA